MWEMGAFGRRLRKARKAAQMTQRAVADALDCTQGFISRVEDGHLMLQAADYPVVAELLGVSILDLLGPLTTEERTQIAADEARQAEDRREAGYGVPSD